MGWYCVRCGGNHPLAMHNAIMQPSMAPLETPSHNGPYQGTVPVREVAPGVSFQDDEGSTAAVKAAIGRNKQSLMAQEVKALCVVCEKPFTKAKGYNGKHHKYCSDRCYLKAYRAKQKAFEAQRRPHRKVYDRPKGKVTKW